MNLNDFVVLPKSKAKSVKLNARNPQELQMKVATLARESREMEEKLQQLKESIRKEKEERGHSGGFRWRSGQSGSRSNSSKKSKESTLQKLSAGKMRIRVLKDEQLTAPSQSKPPPLPPPPITDLQKTRGKRLSGTVGGQREEKTVREVSAVNQAEEKKVEMIERWSEREDERGISTSHLWGEYNEEESARSFQEALRQWREEQNEDAPKTPVSHTATQADFTLDGNGNFPIRVEFTENSIPYMERLLLKKHRRTPIETHHPSLPCGTDSNTTHNINHEEETTSNLTAQEEDLRRYCASLFAVPVSRGSTEPRITLPESYLPIEILDEKDKDTVGECFAERRTENDKKVQRLHIKGGTTAPQTAITSGGSSRPASSGAREQSKAVLKPLDLQEKHSSKTSSYQRKPSPCPITKAPRTLKASIKTPTSKLQKPNCSPTVHKSKPDCGSSQHLSSSSLTHFQTENLKSSHAPVSFPCDVSPSACIEPLVTKEPLASSPSTLLSLRSMLTVSPSGSTVSPLLPKVYQSTPFQKCSGSSPLPEQPQFSQSFPALILSLEHSQSPPHSLDSLRQSRPSLHEQESSISVNQARLLLSPVSSSRDPSPKCSPVKILSGSSVFNESPSDQYCRHRSTPAHEEAPLFMFHTPTSGDHESTMSLQAPPWIPSTPLKFLNSIKNPLDMKMEAEDDLSADSGEEMSSDSLSMNLHEEESSEDEDQMHNPASRGWTREEEQRNPAACEEREEDSQTSALWSKPSMMMKKQRAGSGSDRSCDLDGFLPPGLSMNSGYINTPEHTRCDSQHTSQTPVDDSDPTGSEEDWPRGSFIEHPSLRMMIDNHSRPTGIQLHPTPKTRRRETSANKPGRSTFSPLSRAAQEIMEICSVNQGSCEDQDILVDTAAHTLQQLEQELRLMTTDVEKQTSAFCDQSSRSQDEHKNFHLKRGKINKELEDEEAAAQGDQQSVLLLP